MTKMVKNFYWLKTPFEGHENEPKNSIFIHIGKMSSSGKYCFECGTTYHVEGTKANAIKNSSYEKCPMCGKPRKDAILAYSFTWTVMKHKKVLQGFVSIHSDAKVVVDEHDVKYSAKEFLDFVDVNCPIQSQLPRMFS